MSNEEAGASATPGDGPTELLRLLDMLQKTVDSGMKALRAAITDAAALFDPKKRAPVTPAELSSVAYVAHLALWCGTRQGKNKTQVLEQALELALWMVATGFLPINARFAKPVAKSEVAEPSLMSKLLFRGGREDLSAYEPLAEGDAIHEQLAAFCARSVVPFVVKQRVGEPIATDLLHLLSVMASCDAATEVSASGAPTRSAELISVTPATLGELLRGMTVLIEPRISADLQKHLTVVMSAISQQARDENVCGALTYYCGLCDLTRYSSPFVAMCQSLVLQLLVNGGPNFRNSTEVQAAIAAHVFPLLMRCSLSSEHDTHRLAFSTFLSVFRNFKRRFATEVEGYFADVVFKLLDSTVIDARQQCLLIDLLLSIVEEPSNVIDIFLNFDCNTQRQSIYEGILQRMSALAGGSTEPLRLLETGVAPPEYLVVAKGAEDSVRRKALTFMALLISANHQWIERFENDVEEQRRAALDAAEEGTQPRRAHERSMSDQAQPLGGGGGDVAHQLRLKKDLEHTVFLFNEKVDPVGAVRYALECGLVPSRATPPIFDEAAAEDVARFFVAYERRLDKVALGEFFSRIIKSKAVFEVFRHWTRLQQFGGLELDEALRIFLGGFKMAGEAQLVDKSMETFAEVYCAQNPSSPWAAQSAFIIAFSICMLNTDAHSPHVKDKMTLAEFVRNNRGINNGTDISEDVLAGIYNRIVSNEIVLRGVPHLRAADAGRGTSHGLTDGMLGNIPVLRSIVPVATAVVMYPFDKAGDIFFDMETRRRDEAQKKEFQRLFEAAIASLVTKRKDAGEFQAAASLEHAIPMWDITADSVISSLLAHVEYLDRNASSASSMSSSFSSVVPSDDLDMVVSKNLLECLHVCVKYGDLRHVLYVIERLFELHKTASSPAASSACAFGLLRIFRDLGDSIPRRGWKTLHLLVMHVNRQRPPPRSPVPAVPKSALSKSSSPALVSIAIPLLLDDPAFQELVAEASDPQRYVPETQLAMVVAASECATLRHGPFSVNRLVDLLRVAMDVAPRIQWREMWRRCAERFVQLLEESVDAAAYGCVLLGFRKLLLANLRKEEGIGFQVDLVRPLLDAFIRKEDARAEIVSIVAELVDVRAECIDAAWGTVLNIIGLCCSKDSLGRDAWRVLLLILTTPRLALLASAAFQDLIACVASYAGCHDADTAVSAIQYVAQCAEWLDAGLPSYDTAEAGLVRVPASREAACWTALQSSIVGVVTSGSSDTVRIEATQTLTLTLRRFGERFEAFGLWPQIRRDLAALVRRVCDGTAPMPVVALLLHHSLHDFYRVQRDSELITMLLTALFGTTSRCVAVQLYASLFVSLSLGGGTSWAEHLFSHFDVRPWLALNDCTDSELHMSMTAAGADALRTDSVVELCALSDQFAATASCSEAVAAAAILQLSLIVAKCGDVKQRLSSLDEALHRCAPSSDAFATVAYCCALGAVDANGAAFERCLRHVVERTAAAHQELVERAQHTGCRPGEVFAASPPDDALLGYANGLIALVSILHAAATAADDALRRSAVVRDVLCDALLFVPSATDELVLRTPLLSTQRIKSRVFAPDTRIAIAVSSALRLPTNEPNV